MTEERNQTIINYIQPKISNPKRINGIAYGESQVKNNPGYEYTIVISSLKSKKNAIKFIEKLKELKKDTFIEKTNLNFHVLVGKFESYREAKKYLVILNQKGHEGWIKKSNCRKNSESIHQSNRKTTFKIKT